MFANACHSVAPTASADSAYGGSSSWPVASTHSPGSWAVKASGWPSAGISASSSRTVDSATRPDRCSGSVRTVSR